MRYIIYRNKLRAGPLIEAESEFVNTAQRNEASRADERLYRASCAKQTRREQGGRIQTAQIRTTGSKEREMTRIGKREGRARAPLHLGGTYTSGRGDAAATSTGCRKMRARALFLLFSFPVLRSLSASCIFGAEIKLKRAGRNLRERGGEREYKQ